MIKLSKLVTDWKAYASLHVVTATIIAFAAGFVARALL